MNKAAEAKAGGYFHHPGMKRIISLLILIVFTAHLHFLPAVCAAENLTVDEAAGRKEKKQALKYNDEFSGKAPERRDSGTSHQEKDPRLACMLSLIVPGGGHIYLREDLKAISFCLLSGAGYSAAGYYLYQSLFGGASSTESKSKLIIAGLLFVTAAIIHVVGVVEAYNDAIDINEKRFYYGEGRSETPYVARIEYE